MYRLGSRYFEPFRLGGGMERLLTNEECALAIEGEGRLVTDVVVDAAGGRCAIGVLSDYAMAGSRCWARRLHPFYLGLVDENNGFRGTPEERCAHMAAWIRRQEPRKVPEWLS